MITTEEQIELEALVLYEEAQKGINDFYAYCEFMDSSFFNNRRPYLRDIANLLQRVESHEINKLAISMPPRAGKSYIITMFCTWLIGKHPQGSIMRNSYAAELAEKFSYEVRQIIKSDRYKLVFPTIELKTDKKAVNDWAVQGSKQTTYFCAGVGGAITGKGCDLAAIADDLIKNIEDALSENVLNKTWQWVTSTHNSRLEKGCPQIHIATRWSRKDPIGMLLDAEIKEWTVYNVPALINGKTFCEDVKTTEEFLQIKRLTDDFIWEAEYMQNPIEAKGLLYPIEELKRFSLDEVSKYDTSKEKWDGIVNYTDTADEGTDYLSSVTGKALGKYIYLTDVVFTQDPVEVTEGRVAQMIIDSNCDKAVIESNAGGKSFGKNIKNLISEDSKCHVIWKPSTKNKETRIFMKSGIVKEFVYFRNDYELGSDYDKFIRQLTSYVRLGTNKHDDAADSITGLVDEMFRKSVEFLK